MATIEERLEALEKRYGVIDSIVLQNRNRAAEYARLAQMGLVVNPLYVSLTTVFPPDYEDDTGIMTGARFDGDLMIPLAWDEDLEEWQELMFSLATKEYVDSHTGGGNGGPTTVAWTDLTGNPSSSTPLLALIVSEVNKVDVGGVPDPVALRPSDIGIGDGLITIQWQEPGGNGTFITGYEITVRAVEIGFELVQNLPPTARQFELQGLENGVNYLIEIYSLSKYGRSKRTYVNVNPAEVSTTPTLSDFEVFPFSNRIAAVFRADNGGSPILEYAYQLDGPGPFVPFSPHFNENTGEYSYSITELDNGTEYSVRIRATNTNGAYTTQPLTATPIEDPDAPSPPSAITVYPVEKGLLLMYDIPSIGSSEFYRAEVEYSYGDDLGGFGFLNREAFYAGKYHYYFGLATGDYQMRGILGRGNIPTQILNLEYTLRLTVVTEDGALTGPFSQPVTGTPLFTNKKEEPIIMHFSAANTANPGEALLHYCCFNGNDPTQGQVRIDGGSWVGIGAGGNHEVFGDNGGYLRISNISSGSHNFTMRFINNFGTVTTNTIQYTVQ